MYMYASLYFIWFFTLSYIILYVVLSIELNFQSQFIGKTESAVINYFRTIRISDWVENKYWFNDFVFAISNSIKLDTVNYLLKKYVHRNMLIKIICITSI